MVNFFKLRENGTTVKVELLGGLTTFLTMAYIIFVNPGILSTDFAGNPTGLTFDAAMLATCLAAALATLLMGIFANYPIALAPGMGENFFFVGVVMALAAAGVENAWNVALGIVFISGVLFLILTLFRFRKAIIDAVSPSLRCGIAVGIGLFIAFIGLKNAGVIQVAGGLIKMNHEWFNLHQPGVLIFFIGLFIMAGLHSRKVKGSILIGILISAVISLLWGQTKFTGVIGVPKSHALFALNIKSALSLKWLGFICVFLFMDLFDTVGTLIGVGEQGGFIKDNKLPRANQAMTSDAVGTLLGSFVGTSTVTSYIESAVGVEYGARTGLANMMTGALFILAIFFAPLAGMIGNYAPITAPALVIVGAMMVNNVRKIEWTDYSEAIPAFLAMIGIPLSFSIADGLALGFVSYPIVKILSGKGKEVSWVIYLVAALLIARYLFVKM
jgi:AGZA family xanthine/uracil permease-like MFS transporter